MGSGSDSSTTGELFDINMIFILVGTILMLGRTWMDVFILTVNVRDWMEKKRLSTTDRILTLQGSIRISLGCLDLIQSILKKCCPWVTQIDYVHEVYMFSFWYLMSCNIWLTTSLCTYYCVKIADFSHPFFVHLKLRLSGLVSTWLFGSAILSLAGILPFAYLSLEKQDNRNSSNFSQNKNAADISHTGMAFRMYVLLGLGPFAAFGICAISAVLLLFSLWRHRQRMLGSWGGHRSPQTDAHFQAVITILSLLVNNVAVFVSIELALSKGYAGSSVSPFGISTVLFCCFSVESFISVWGNKKLKNKLRRSFHFARCRECVR